MYAEANHYLDVEKTEGLLDSDNVKSRMAQTAYAKSKHAFALDRLKTADGLPAENWWLRSPGNNQEDAALVSRDGSLSNTAVGNDELIRPAFWLDLESDIF